MNGDLYVDICKDVERRIREHEAGKNRYTKGLRPWILMHVEEFSGLVNCKTERKIL